jgi:hypothetical protein
MDSIKENLEALRESHLGFEVSVLIGAGFSKNICKNYPSWEALLHDMVAELYKFEILYGFVSSISSSFLQSCLIIKTG